MATHPTRRILGVDFFIGGISEAVDIALSQGGLVVAPSAPGLAVDLMRSPAYREALTHADMAITDSSFMVMLWRVITGERLPRHSGLKFMHALLARPELKKARSVFWVMPSAEEEARNRVWLGEQGCPVTAEDVYVAPLYGPGEIVDAELLNRIRARRPAVVMLAIGGGVQERVGLMLRDHLEGTPAILCLGAAISFFSGAGGQSRIPMWADRLMLGLLVRFLGNPRRFWRRYWDSLPLVSLIWKYRDRLPPLKPAR